MPVFAIASAVFIAAFVATGSVSSAPLENPTELKAAVKALELKQAPFAIALLKPLVAKYPKIADYTAWFLASAEFDAGQFSDVPKTLEGVWTQSPPSPLVWRAALLGSRAYLQTSDPHAAVALLRKYYDQLPQPQGDSALSAALAADGDTMNAALFSQRVYYNYPTTSEAAQAETDLEHWRLQLGERYPPVLGSTMLSRAVKLLESGQSDHARKELLALIPQVGGAERDMAQVKIGVADYNKRDNAAARRYLADLKVESPDADAERLFYLLQCARRLNDHAGMQEILDQLSKLYPTSPQRLEAVLAVASSHLVENEADQYEPLYQTCADVFPNDPRAADCHWKYTWSRYLRRQPDAPDALRDHLRRFPGSDHAVAALYFLARTTQAANDWSSTRAYYDEIVREYPNHYYASLARERLAEMQGILSVGDPSLKSVGDSSPKQAAAAGAVPGLLGANLSGSNLSGSNPAGSNFVGPNQALAFLHGIAFPTRVRTRSFDLDPVASQRIDRARILSGVGLDDWAEIELRYAAQYEKQPHLMALELASMASRRSNPSQALRYLKRYAGDFLFLPIESAPDEFWKLAFPLPYRAEVERYARENQLDPFFLAALIRQESEFDMKATNAGSSARGLTQILPSTGRELSRSMNLRPYSTASLYQPSVNLRLGAYYLRSIADKLDGRWEAVLAAYNAGPARAAQWLKWGDFREPAEFVETIPYRETHNYVEVIMRNADTYRRIYAAQRSAPSNPLDPPKPAFPAATLPPLAAAPTGPLPGASSALTMSNPLTISHVATAASIAAPVLPAVSRRATVSSNLSGANGSATEKAAKPTGARLVKTSSRTTAKTPARTTAARTTTRPPAKTPAKTKSVAAKAAATRTTTAKNTNASSNAIDQSKKSSRSTGATP